MADLFSPQKRSRIMSRIKGKNTKPELLVRSLVHRLGYRFRLHRKDLPGNPDIVLPRHRKIILVHGCFWHQHPDCPRAALPSTNMEFWTTKLTKNRERDLRNIQALEEQGWKVLVIWQCETKDPEALYERCLSFLTG